MIMRKQLSRLLAKALAVIMTVGLLGNSGFFMQIDAATRVSSSEQGTASAETMITLDKSSSSNTTTLTLDKESSANATTVTLAKSSSVATTTLTLKKSTAANSNPTTESEGTNLDDEGKVKAIDCVKLNSTAPEVSIIGMSNSGIDALIASFTEEEKAQYALGHSIQLILQSKDLGDDVPSADREAIELVKANMTIGMYIDLSLNMKVGSAAQREITDLDGEVELELEIPTELVNSDSSVERTYYLIHVHNGVTEVLDTTFNTKKGTITFKINGFSTFAIAYEDSSEEEQSADEILDLDLTILLAQAKQKSSKVNKITWEEQEDATAYEIYWSYCGKGNEYSILKTVSAGKTLKAVHYLPNAKKNYKYFVAAYKLVDGEKVYISCSPVLHVAKSTSKKTNAKNIKVEKASVSIKVDKTYKIKATIVKQDEDKDILSHVAALRYYTSDKSVATVNKNGKITAKAKGTCTIYVVANNGVTKKVEVTVK